MPHLFTVGDTVRYNNEARRIIARDNDEHIVADVISVPPSETADVGHTQWLQLHDKAALISGALLDPVLP